MYTYKEAEKIFDYYSDKVIGEQIEEGRGEGGFIDYLKIEELVDHTFNVFCYPKGNDVRIKLYRDIESVANDLGLILPTEVLEQ